MKNSAGKVVVTQSGAVGTSDTLTSKQSALLKSGQTYTWLVEAVSTNGQADELSNGETFTD